MALTKVDDRGLKTPIDLQDNEKIRLGTGNDLELYHNGNNSRIENSTGQLKLKAATAGTSVQMLGAGDEMMVQAISNGAVELYHNDSKKLETMSWGTQIYGALATTGNLDCATDSYKIKAGAGGDIEIYHNGTDSYIKNLTGDFFIEGVDNKYLYIRAKAGENSIICKDDGAVELYYDNSKKIETTSAGALVTGSLEATDDLILSGANANLRWDKSDDALEFMDNGKAVFGTGDDLQIYHDAGAASHINATGLLNIDGTTGVRLEYNNATRLETTSSGTTTTGDGYLSGRLLVGTTTAGESNGDEATFYNSGNAGITIRSGVDDECKIYFSEGTSGGSQYRGAITYDHDTNYMSFATNENERIRIDSSGRLLVGSGSVSLPKGTGSGSLDLDNGTLALCVGGNNGSTGRSDSTDKNAFIAAPHYTNAEQPIPLITGSSASSDNIVNIGGGTSLLNAVTKLRFYTAANTTTTTGTERFRVNPDGEVCFGITTTPSATQGGTGIATAISGLPVFIKTSSKLHSANAYTHYQFFNSNGAVGEIRTNGSATAFLTSSDYRLKENETPITDGITRLKQFKPYKFNFKADPSTVLDGFFAHEVSSIVPEAVSGEKDYVATEANVKSGLAENVGDIISQGLDTSKLVPLLIAALQEAITKIESLETKVAALEAA